MNSTGLLPGSILNVAVAPLAVAVFSTMRCMLAMIASRCFGSNVRMVPMELGAVGHDVIAHACIDRADGEHRRIQRDVDLTARRWSAVR